LFRQTDITAIYNSNAVFAYVLSIYLLRSERWETFKVVSVVFACAGVFVIAYGDSSPAPGRVGLGSRLAGNLLALFGSVSYGFYEVWYKKYGSCPTEIIQRHSVSLYDSALRRRTSSRALLGSSVAEDPVYHGISVNPPSARTSEDLTKKSGKAKAASRVSVTDEVDELDVAEAAAGDTDFDEDDLSGSDDAGTNGLLSSASEDGESVEQASPTLALTHANFVTALIGAFTLVVFWIPIPILHWLHVEVRYETYSM
jgi:hypothetical protein